MDGVKPATGTSVTCAACPGSAQRIIKISANAGVVMFSQRDFATMSGLAVTIQATDDAEPETFALNLIASDGSVAASLGRVEAQDVIAIWRGFTQASGVPGLLIDSDGVICRPYSQLGRLMLGAIRIRRRHGFLAGRRPRFLVRRKTARLPDSPIIHRGRALSSPI
jgi:hypothetical protein